MAATVSKTAAKFSQGLRPNKLTAEKPTTTRNAVTLFGVHRMGIGSVPNGESNALAKLPIELT
jgi:hypothetical protein